MPYVVLRHEDSFASGHPDLSITWGETLWVELKWLKFQWQHELQRVTVEGLAQHGRCVVIVYGPGWAEVGDMEPTTLSWLPPRRYEGRGDELHDMVIKDLRRYLARGGG